MSRSYDNNIFYMRVFLYFQLFTSMYLSLFIFVLTKMKSGLD